MKRGDLDILGLGGYEVGQPARVPLPRGAVARGFSAADASVFDADFAELARRDFEDCVFLEARVPILEEAGVRITLFDRESRVVRLEDMRGEGLEARGAPEALYSPADSPGVIYTDLRRTALVGIRLPDGSAFALRQGAASIDVFPLLPRSLDVRPIGELGCPIEEWLGDCQDCELAAWVREHVEVGGAWHRVVAAGIYARLLNARGGDARQVVGDLLAGRPDPELARPLRWARSLSAEMLDDLEDLALAEVDLLRERVERLRERLEMEDETWRADLLSAFHRRDDLEGLHVLLTEANHAERLAMALDGLDHAGERLMIGFPREIHFDDPRLRRAALGDPRAWWVMVVRS